MKKVSLSMKIAAGVVLAPVLLALGLTIALKIYLSPAKLRALIVDAAQKQLNREVRIKDISLSIVSGLGLQGLEISEKPAFSAGTFAAMEEFELRVQWAPLLRKQVIIDRVSAKGVSANIVVGRDGQFNFADLMAPSSAPAKKPAPAGDAPALVLDVKRASLSNSRLSYKDTASGEAWNISDLSAKISNLSFEKPFALEASLNVSQPVPGGLKAALSYAGEIDLSQQAKGKIDAAIDKLKAEVSGIALEAAGHLALDNDRLSLPDLKGKFAGANMKGSLLVKNRVKAPDIEVKLDFDDLNLSAVAAKRQAAAPAPPAAPSSGAVAAPAKAAPPSPPIAARGSVHIGKLTYTNLSAQNAALTWNLTGITPDLKKLGGWAKLNVAGGTLDREEKTASRSPLVKALLVPLTIIKPIGALGEKLKLLPDFNHIVFTEILGDYVFERGLMTLKDFHMYSDAAKIKTTGTIDLPAQRLNLKVNAAVAKLAPLDIDVGGTFEKPEPRFRLDKILAAPVKKLLAEPAADIFKKLFKKD